MTLLSHPLQNQLLAALPPAVWAQWQSQFETVALARGKVLHECGAPLRHVYFPTTAVVSLLSVMSDGASAEIAVVGNEGIVGVGAYMGGGATHDSGVVQHAGYAMRMAAPAIARACNESAAVRDVLLRYTQALIAQMSQLAACNRHHRVDQQLCRWLLLTLDRQTGNELAVTQEGIANLLGVRREGVTGGALKLQRAGLIRYTRGRISVLDRAGIEERSCECYGVVRTEYDRLLPETLAA